MGRDAAVDSDFHGLRSFLDETLGGQHVFDFTGPDAERQCPECAMGRGMRIPADNRHAGQREPLLRTDDVHDSLTHVVHGEQCNTEVGAMLFECFNLNATQGIRNTHVSVGGRHVMVRYRQRGSRPARLPSGQLEPFKGLRRGHFMDQVAVDIQ